MEDTNLHYAMNPHAATVAQMVEDGTTQITINDNNEQAWESGLASYLMENYHYINLRSSFIAYINKPKNAGV